MKSYPNFRLEPGIRNWCSGAVPKWENLSLCVVVQNNSAGKKMGLSSHMFLILRSRYRSRLPRRTAAEYFLCLLGIANVNRISRLFHKMIRSQQPEPRADFNESTLGTLMGSFSLFHQSGERIPSEKCNLAWVNSSVGKSPRTLLALRSFSTLAKHPKLQLCQPKLRNLCNRYVDDIACHALHTSSNSGSPRQI